MGKQKKIERKGNAQTILQPFRFIRILLPVHVWKNNLLPNDFLCVRKKTAISYYVVYDKYLIFNPSKNNFHWIHRKKKSKRKKKKSFLLHVGFLVNTVSSPFFIFIDFYYTVIFKFMTVCGCWTPVIPVTAENLSNLRGGWNFKLRSTMTYVGISFDASFLLYKSEH